MKNIFHLKVSLEQMTLWMMIIALFAFLHGLYRTNINESNQTQRDAGFRILMVSNELQTLLDTNYYHMPIKNIHYLGWSKVLIISDMSIFMDKKVIDKAKELTRQWKSLSQNLKNKQAHTKFSNCISSFKSEVKNNLIDLN